MSRKQPNPPPPSLRGQNKRSKGKMSEIKPKFGTMYVATWMINTKTGRSFSRQASYIIKNDDLDRGYHWVRLHFEHNKFMDRMVLTITTEKESPYKYFILDEDND